MLTKAQTLGADMVFLDLEDAVAPSVKASAREAVVEALVQGQWGERIRSVRINAVGTRWALDDLRTVVAGAGEHLDTVMLPKCSDPSHVHWLDHSLAMLESALGLPRGGIGIELQIEDARGLTEVDAISAASTRTQALHFGPGDFQASLGMPSLSLGGLDDRGGDPLHHVLGRLLVSARAHGLQVLDGPFLGIHDVDGLAAAARRVAAMGFDGKWVLHPAQVEVVNEVFTPTQEAYDHAELVLDAYAYAATEAGGARGAVMLGEEMIDEASRAMALVLTARGRAAGLVRSSSFTPPA
jgi:citrate lyase subunit beta / citryl-CoA lyase